ncbi:histidinol-phosphate transaminase [Kocuria palustris]|uniref:histidinol-phosphate transaminase n=1 Tax=Kocuria palustris TaxID=71999 RepID=UPI0011A91D5F|nr:histidinol-phosphate transaminase [Kocuria palustris]
MSAVTPRAALSALPAYAAGKPPQPVEGLEAFKLSSNENPWGPVPAARDAIAEAAGRMHRYPDPTASALRERIGAHLSVPAEDVVTGAGSLGALTQIIAAFAGTASDGRGDEVIYAWRSFEAYPIVVGTAGATGVQIPNRADGSHDLEAMLAAITPRTRVILLCTPNNPTGPSLRQDETDRFLEQVPEHILVVIDEAYQEFQGDPELVDGVRTCRRRPNVVALRTFSKAHGLAGLRVGYSVSQPEITASLRKVATTFAVTDIAQAAAIASLDHLDQVEERVGRIVAERERILERLGELGWDVPQTRANFVWLPLGDDARRFAEICAGQALSVRAFDGDGVRVSVDVPEANDRFLEICSNFSPAPRHVGS